MEKYLPIPLVERSNKEIAHIIEKKAASIQGIERCKVQSITSTRKKPTIHLLAVLDGNPSYEEAHRISSTIGMQTRKVLSNVNLVILSESNEARNEQEKVHKIVKAIADDEPGFRGSQNVHLRELDGKLGVDFTILEAGGSFQSPVGIEEKILAADSLISEVIIHREPLSDLVRSERSGHGSEVKWYVEHIVWRFPDLKLLTPPIVHRLGDQLHVMIKLDPTSYVNEKGRAKELASAIKNGFPTITKVTILE